MKKFGIPGIFSLLCTILFLLYLKNYITANDANIYALILTALIVLWYTYETSEIRKAEHLIARASEESQKHQKRPVIGYSIYTHPDLKHQTRINISNASKYPLAARINCNFRLDGELIQDFSDAYNGRKFWNLQYQEAKEGHFSWLELHVKKGLLEEATLRNIQKMASHDEKNKETMEIIAFFYNHNPPTLSMDLEIYCENDMGFQTYYPPVHYDYHYRHNVWVPILESDKPYWEFDKKPCWVE